MAKISKGYFDQMMDEARKRVSEFDKVDGGPDVPQLPRNAACAIESAIRTASVTGGGLKFNNGDLSCLFDALVYLEQFDNLNGRPNGPMDSVDRIGETVMDLLDVGEKYGQV